MRGIGLTLALLMTPAIAAATPAPSQGAVTPALGALSDKVMGAPSDSSRSGQVSQSATRPCPLALGLPRPNDAAIAHRIADQGSASRPHRPCRTPNIYIRFTSELRPLSALI